MQDPELTGIAGPNRQRLRDRLLILALGVLVFFAGLGNHELWNPDEPRYAEVAREMRLRGDYVVPHVNGEVYAHKPPLLFWSMSLAASLRGQLDEVAARLPSAIAGLVTLLLTFELGWWLFGRSPAWIAALALLTCYKIPGQARCGQIDMLLTSLVTLAMVSWIWGYRTGKPLGLRLFFVAAGFATLAKGPVGLLPPLLAIVVFLVLTKQRREIGRLRLGLGLGIWALIVLVWLVPAGIMGGQDYLQEILYKQNVTRAVNPWHHYRPFYYYLPALLAGFFPWSMLLPAAIVAGVKQLRDKQREFFVLALCWVCVTLVFFSLSPAKRDVYIVTMYPGIALVVGAGLCSLRDGWPRFRHWLLWPLGLAAGLLAATIIMLPSLAAQRPELESVDPATLGYVVAVVGALTAGLIACFVLSLGGRIIRGAAALAVGAGVCALVMQLLVLPRMEPLKSVRGLVTTFEEQAPSDASYAMFPSLNAPFVFYLERYGEVLSTQEELISFSRAAGQRWVFAERGALDALEGVPDLVEVARDRDPSPRGWVLLKTGGKAGVGTDHGMLP